MTSRRERRAACASPQQSELFASGIFLSTRSLLGRFSGFSARRLRATVQNFLINRPRDGTDSTRSLLSFHCVPVRHGFIACMQSHRAPTVFVHMADVMFPALFGLHLGAHAFALYAALHLKCRISFAQGVSPIPSIHSSIHHGPQCRRRSLCTVSQRPGASPRCVKTMPSHASRHRHSRVQRRHQLHLAAQNALNI